jgi:hypothetical protein
MYLPPEIPGKCKINRLLMALFSSHYTSILLYSKEDKYRALLPAYTLRFSLFQPKQRTRRRILFNLRSLPAAGR